MLKVTSTEGTQYYCNIDRIQYMYRSFPEYSDKPITTIIFSSPMQYVRTYENMDDILEKIKIIRNSNYYNGYIYCTGFGPSENQDDYSVSKKELCDDCTDKKDWFENFPDNKMEAYSRLDELIKQYENIEKETSNNRLD